MSSFLAFLCFWWFHVDVCTPEISVMPSGPRRALLGKRFDWKVAVSTPAGWGTLSLIPNSLQHHSVCAVTSAKANISKDCGSLLWTRMLRSCVWQEWLRLLGSWDMRPTGVLLFSLCCPWEEVLAKVNSSWHQVWCTDAQSDSRAGALGSGSLGTVTVPRSLGTGALAAAAGPEVGCRAAAGWPQ